MILKIIYEKNYKMWIGIYVVIILNKINVCKLSEILSYFLK